jgi:hypothetical protein
VARPAPHLVAGQHSVAAAPHTASGSLTLIGTGIAAGAHLTAEARAELIAADDVLYLASEPVGDAWLVGLNPRSRSLFPHYRPGVPRDEIYAAMVEEMLLPVRAGRRVCVAFYGHPGILVRPAHAALEQARVEGLSARLLPAVSALDCLVADLGFDPADTGLQAYEATEFLLHLRRPDVTAALVLWQLSVVGTPNWSAEPDTSRLPVLVEYLRRWYAAEHEVVLYEASPYPIAGPGIERLPLHALAEAAVTPMATLYVPRVAHPEPDAEMGARLGVT